MRVTAVVNASGLPHESPTRPQCRSHEPRKFPGRGIRQNDVNATWIPQVRGSAYIPKVPPADGVATMASR